MKYSFMSFSTPKLSLIDTIAVAHRYGYDGIEPRIDAEHAHGIEVNTTPEQRKYIRDQIANSDIQLSCLASSLSYADPSKTDEMIKQTHERIDLASDLAVPFIRVFGGVISKGIEREEAIELLVNSLGKVADHAGERGITLCFETHDDWCDPRHVAVVLQKINHPAIAVNWDIMHPVRMGNATMESAFNILKTWIRHVHIHDGADGEDLKFVPIGTGIIDHKSAVRLLESVDFDGYLSGEWINWGKYDVHLPRELAVMKRYEQKFPN